MAAASAIHTMIYSTKRTLSIFKYIIRVRPCCGYRESHTTAAEGILSAGITGVRSKTREKPPHTRVFDRRGRLRRKRLVAGHRSSRLSSSRGGAPVKPAGGRVPLRVWFIVVAVVVVWVTINIKYIHVAPVPPETTTRYRHRFVGSGRERLYPGGGGVSTRWSIVV